MQTKALGQRRAQACGQIGHLLKVRGAAVKEPVVNLFGAESALRLALSGNRAARQPVCLEMFFATLWWPWFLMHEVANGPDERVQNPVQCEIAEHTTHNHPDVACTALKLKSVGDKCRRPHPTAERRHRGHKHYAKPAERCRPLP